MKDYSREIAWLRRFDRVSNWLNIADAIADPVVAAAKIIGSRRAQFIEGIGSLTSSKGRTFWVTQQLAHATEHRGDLVSSLWNNSPRVAVAWWGDHRMIWRDVYGVPVCRMPGNTFGEFYSPEDESGILERVRLSSGSWIVRKVGQTIVVAAATQLTGLVVPEQATMMIERTKRFAGCRSWLLWGPPGSGKTRMAHAVVDALCDSKVVMTGEVASNPEAWDAVETLRPEGLIVDDLDSVAAKDELLARYDRAHDWARVIVSTANTLGEIRGALVRPGRAADEDPVEVRTPCASVAKELAPNASAMPGADKLLACYLSELEARYAAGVASPDDVAGMVARMEQAGDR